MAYIRGWKIFDKNVIWARSVTHVRNKKQLFYLLDARRADAELISRMAGLAMAEDLGLEDVFFIDPPIAEVPNYLHLHKSMPDWPNFWLKP